ncbi:hypothetical protein [Mesorhizobium tamadayense]|uniref:hypothetical protein n=1 Tax=Mesorhizobium tamadayense TaxID=425306 RepID=UPI0026BDC9A6
MDEHDPKEELIETIFRNGTITVLGILLAFSLGFVTHWAANPVPWRLYDLFAVAPILVGIALQMRALSMLLDISSLRRPIYERANRIFMSGLILTACGVGLAILLDVFAMSAKGCAIRCVTACHCALALRPSSLSVGCCIRRRSGILAVSYHLAPLALQWLRRQPAPLDPSRSDTSQ